MPQNSQNQDSKHKPNEKNLEDESPQDRGAKTRRRNAWATFFDGFGALLIAFAGFSYFVHHLEIPSIALFFIGAIFASFGIRLSLMNRITTKAANVCTGCIISSIMALCIVLAFVNSRAEPEPKKSHLIWAMTTSHTPKSVLELDEPELSDKPGLVILTSTNSIVAIKVLDIEKKLDLTFQLKNDPDCSNEVENLEVWVELLASEPFKMGDGWKERGSPTEGFRQFSWKYSDRMLFGEIVAIPDIIYDDLSKTIDNENDVITYTPIILRFRARNIPTHKIGFWLLIDRERAGGSAKYWHRYCFPTPMRF